MGQRNDKPAVDEDAPPAPKEPFVLGSPKPVVHRHSIMSAPYLLVLLGSENNGKSTFWKQILSNYGKSLTSWMARQVAQAVAQNAVQTIQTLCKISREQGARDPQFRVAENLLPSVQFILNFNDGKLNPQFAEHATHLWSDPGIQACFINRNHRGFILEGGDTLPYLMDNLNRIATEDYQPTEADAIRSYTRTRGTGEHINHSECKLGEHRMLVVDTDGQRGQRDKWQQNHRYEAVSALVVVVSVISYDEVMLDDENTNSMTDSLDLFEQVCALRTFAQTPVVLLLSKVDLLPQKLQKVPLSNYFPDYDSKTNDPQDAIEFIRAKFEQRFMKHRGGLKQKMHMFTVNATDSASVVLAVEEITMIVVDKRTLDLRNMHRPSNSGPLTKMFSNPDMSHE